MKEKPMNETSTILVVDDDPNSLQVLSEMLEQAGFDVRPALSGDIALNAIELSAPDLILLDIRMPGIDGYEVCRRLKAKEATRNIPVIFISGMQEIMDKSQAFRVGGVDYVVKPFQEEEVIARIHTHLQLSRVNVLKREINERKLTEEKLRASEERYRVLSETMLQGVVYQDANGKIIAMNPAAEHILGKSQEQFSGSSSVQEEHDTIRENGGLFPAMEHPAMVALRTGLPVGAVIMGVFNPKLSGYRWISISAVPVFRTDETCPSEVFAVFEDVTERKQAERELRDSEEMHRDILKSAMDGIWLVDTEGRLLDVNKSYCRMSGYSSQELLTMRVSDLEAIETAEVRATHMKKVMELGEDRFETRHRRKDGGLFDVEISVQYRFTEKGRCVAFLRDITERKLKETVPLQSGNLLQLANLDIDLHECMSALTASLQSWSGCDAVGIRLRSGEDYPYFETRGFPSTFVHEENQLCAYGPDGGILRDGEGNPILECMCGNVLCGRFDPTKPFFTNRGSFLSNNTTALLASTAEADRQARTRNRCNGAGYESLALIPMNTGNQIIGLLQFNDRRPDRFTPAFIDICEGMAEKLALTLERRQAGEALVKSEKRYHDLVNTIPDLIWLKDADGVYMSCNVMFERFFGAKEADIIGKTDYDFVDKELADFSRENDFMSMAAGKPSKNEEWITFADDGHRAMLDTIKTPMYDDKGNIIGVLGIGHDITDRKLVEEEKFKLELQLHQAQKMESVGSLAGGVAHDFNNKLSVILGCTYLATSEPDPAKVQSFLEEIRKAAEQSADLTRQLLAFARKQTIMPKVLNLNETVTSTLQMLNRLIGENIPLTWQPGADLWLLNFDPSQVDQILANLCVNARDSITGSGKITIETGNSTIDEDYCAQYGDAVPGEYVRLAVSDNGCGMENEIQSRIFEPFFTTKEVGKGTGLGLATVFGIVKQNSGFINVNSELGLGTTFTIYLPRHVGKSEQGKKEGHAIPAPHGLETILLVEDELAILNISAMILTRQGYTVLQASAPAEAVRITKEHSGEISLLITDVIMPEMNGKELADNLCFLNPQLKCLFMSGYTADVIAQHGLVDGSVNFIHKPFSLPALATKVRDVLDG
jgi:PAS domain S-box-containing protein